MSTVLIVIHLMVVLAMIALVLLQRSEGGALGIGGGGGGLVSRRGAGNLLTRTTGFLAATFFATSIALTIIARMEQRPVDILDRFPVQGVPAPQAPGEAPAEPGTGILDALRQQSGQQQQPQPQQPPAGAPGPQAPAGGGAGPQQPPAGGQ
jgi:preprotein translocase subunit SecG